MTEQVVTPAVVESVQVGELRLPVNVTLVKVNVTVPVGALEAVVVSATVTMTLVVQLDAPSAIVQPTVGCGSEAEVLSLPVAVTVMDAEGLALVLWVESPP